MDESNNPDEGTASIDINEAASLISQQIDVPEDSNEQPEEHVEPTPEEVVETIEDQFFDINGEQISLNDLKTGFMKNADYTKKTQALAEERRVYQQNQRDVNEVRSQAIAGIEALKQELAIQFRTMEQPDWDALLEFDPPEYLRQQAAWQKREASVRQMYEAEQHLRAKQADYEAEQRQIALQESNARLMERYPEWQDPTVANAALNGLGALLGEYQFKGEELEGISDHRIISLIYDYHQLREKHKSVPQVVAKIEQKPVISVKETSRKNTDFDTAQFNKFNNSRSVNDAAALIKGLL